MRNISIGLLFGLLTSALLPACKEGQNGAGEAGKGQKPITVAAIVMVPKPLENRIQATGSLMANEEVELRSELPGRIVSISFEEGSHVAKGALLLKIDDRELQAQLKKLQVEEKQAADDLYRKEKLLELKAVSQEEYDRASNTLGIIRAQIDLVATQISKTGIYAPFSGQIGLRQVSPGGFVSSSTLVARLHQTDPVKIDFAIPEKYREKVKAGTRITFRVEGIDSTFTGRVYALDSKIDPATRNVTLRAVCPNPSGLLIPGAFARVDLLLESLADAMVVPSEAIIPKLNGEMVYLCRDGKARSVQVETGLRTEREVQVKSGLAAGDTLIYTGLLQLREGMAVTARVPQEKEPAK